MNIIIVSNYFPPEMGAAPSRIYFLAKGLKEREHDVSVIAPLPNYPTGKIFDEYKRKFKKKEEIDGIHVHRYWISPSVSKNKIKRALSMFSFAVTFWFGFFTFKKKKPDLFIIQHSPLFVSYSAMFMAKRFKKSKRVLNISDLWPLSALELGVIGKGKMYNLMEKIEKSNYKNAQLIMGQSNEILSYVAERIKKDSFLYRNITPVSFDKKEALDTPRTTNIVYAGLLGVAQGILAICENINFNELGVEFHIYGNGNEKELIEEFITQNPNSNIVYKGSVTKEEIQTILPEYRAAIVPLANRIFGAVPSKIYELISLKVPILFCGGGEGAEIIEEFKVGYTSEPNDFEKLSGNIKKIIALDNERYKEIIFNCSETEKKALDFEGQMNELNIELEKLMKK